MERNYCLSVK